jgi:hypothetical protein
MVRYMLHDLSVVDLNHTRVLGSLCVQLRTSRCGRHSRTDSPFTLYNVHNAVDVWHHLTIVLASSSCWVHLPLWRTYTAFDAAAALRFHLY